MHQKAIQTIEKRVKRQKEEAIEHLRKTPIVHLVCERTGISRATFYRWKEDPAFAALVDEAMKEGLASVSDMAESQLMAAIKDRNMAAITFWLKHHHPTYKTKLEVNGFVHHFAERLTPEQEKVVRDAIRLASFTIPVASLYERQNATENSGPDAQ